MNLIPLADGTMVQFITYATSKETGSTEVVYQEMKPPYPVYTINETDFMKMIDDDVTVDKPKAPAVKPQTATQEVAEKPAGNLSIMEQFLDADTYRQKIRILEIHRDLITSDQLELLAAAMDEYIEGMDQEELFYSFMQILKTRARFETDRK